MAKTKKKLVIWDSDEIPEDGLILLYWKGYYSEENSESILNLIEKNAELVRSEYLSFVHMLGKDIRIKGKNLVEHFLLPEGISLWWMTLLAEKSPFRSRTVQNCLRLIALKKYLIDNSISHVELVSSSYGLVKSISLLCSSLGVSFHNRSTKKRFKRYMLFSARKKVVYFLQGFYYFLLKINELRFIKIKNSESYFKENSIFLFSYFDNLNFEELTEGKFFSSYWNTFPTFLKNNKYGLNWMHHFSASTKIPDLKTGEKFLNLLYKSNKSSERHLFFDSFLSFRVLTRSFFMWIRLILKVFRITKELKNELYSRGYGCMWTEMEDDWIISTYGVNGIQNLIWINQFNSAFNDIPKQKIGLFLCENQNWERAFVFFWKKYGHGKLAGILHTPLIYWDLRILESKNFWLEGTSSSKHLPDYFALCGKASVQCYKEASQPLNKIFKVEALRYEHLDFEVEEKKSKKVRNQIDAKINTLIMGGVMPETTNKMLETLNSEPEVIKNLNLTLKPHPSNPINTKNFPNLELQVSNQPLKFLFSKNSLAISSIYTSAGLEAYCAGLKVLTFLDPDELNFSPLKGQENAHFFNKGREIESMIRDIEIMDTSAEEFFFLDVNYSRWNEFLKILN